MGREPLYCAVQSRSPDHQTTTEKVQSSARDGTSSATVHTWQTTAGCSTYVLKPLNVCWTVPPAWLCQQSADDAECRRQMSREGSQQCTTALFRKDSGRLERTARMWLAPELATNGTHEAMGGAEIQDWAMTDEVARVDIAGLDNDGRHGKDWHCKTAQWRTGHWQTGVIEIMKKTASRKYSYAWSPTQQ